jgi:hypothetical protein
MSKKESSYGIDYERHEESDSSSFSDPFAVPEDSRDYGDVYMSREDYGLLPQGNSNTGDAYEDTSSSGSSGGSGGGGGSRSGGSGSSAGSQLDMGHLASAMGSSRMAMSEFGSSARERPAATQFTTERRGLWAQASYNIGAWRARRDENPALV